MEGDENSNDEDELKPKTYSIYFGNNDEDRDLHKWIEFEIDPEKGDYSGPSHLFKDALRTLRDEKRDEIQ